MTARPGPEAPAPADGLALEIFPDAASAGRAAAARIAREADAAVRRRGRFLLALSGGRSPGPMLRALAREAMPWPQVHLFQADERAAPEGDPERNWTQICVDLLGALDPAGPGPRLHPMPAAEPDLAAAAERYARDLEAVAGRPPVLDLVQLGLGDDGHTASLVPGDAALARLDAPVAATDPYRGRRRLTLSFATLAAARRVLWLVTGAEKRAALCRLRAGDPTIPAGRVARGHAVIFADAAAVGRPDGAAGHEERS